MFGVPDNFNASHGERLLKTFAKTPSRWCQLRQDRFNTQLAGQVHLMQVFHNALESAKPVHPVLPTDMMGNRSGFKNFKSTFLLDREKGSLCWRDRLGRSCEPHPLIATRFKDNPLEQFFCCEYVDTNNHCYRAHPDFGGDGPFYDFVRIRNSDNELIPARILTFYKSNDDGRDMVAVHPARRMVENHNIIQRWEMAMTISRGVFVPRIVNFPVEKIETPLLAFVEGGNNGFMETYHARLHILAVEKPELWPLHF
jgi:hypothetical protein